MNREETKIFLKKIVPMMQAFAEGKNIERQDGSIWKEENDPDWWVDDETFRVQKEKKYVPFTYNDIEKVKGYWVKWKNSDAFGQMHINGYDKIGVIVGPISYSYKAAFDLFVFEDGTPFGKEEK
jgi:hypothetical protein